MRAEVKFEAYPCFIGDKNNWNFGKMKSGSGSKAFPLNSGLLLLN